jgi:hypothetical protein
MTIHGEHEIYSEGALRFESYDIMILQVCAIKCFTTIFIPFELLVHLGIMLFCCPHPPCEFLFQCCIPLSLPDIMEVVVRGTLREPPFSG